MTYRAIVHVSGSYGSWTYSVPLSEVLSNRYKTIVGHGYELHEEISGLSSDATHFFTAVNASGQEAAFLVRKRKDVLGSGSLALAFIEPLIDQAYEHITGHDLYDILHKGVWDGTPFTPFDTEERD